MEEKTKKSIKGLGLTFKIISGFMFCAGFGFFIISLIFKVIATTDPSVDKFVFNSFVFKNFWLLALIQCSIAGLIFFTSFQFEKIHYWAKIVLEIFCWLLIISIISEALFYTWSKPLFVKIFSICSMIPWLFGDGILICFLCKKEIKEAFKK